MKIESHLENLKESVREIEEAVAKDLTEKQRTIGFHASAGAIDMIEIILHKNKLIDPGFIIKHEWFNSKRKVSEKLNFEFPKKKTIIELTTSIESVRNKLCYGKKQESSVMERTIKDFNKLKKIFMEITDYEL